MSTVKDLLLRMVQINSRIEALAPAYDEYTKLQGDAATTIHQLQQELGGKVDTGPIINAVTEIVKGLDKAYNEQVKEIIEDNKIVFERVPRL